MEELKDLRIEKKLTQQKAADQIGISLRSYISYENDSAKRETPKYRFIMQEIERLNKLDEEHGVLEIKDIVSACESIFADYKIDFCYLFGSYAKGVAKENSDIDLVISGEVGGLKFYGLVETLREKLHKKIDLLDIKQLLNNEALLKEVLKDGMKIYG